MREILANSLRAAWFISIGIGVLGTLSAGIYWLLFTGDTIAGALALTILFPVWAIVGAVLSMAVTTPLVLLCLLVWKTATWQFRTARSLPDKMPFTVRRRP